MGFKGNSFNGQLQTITKLFNGTLQCYESALLLQKCWFLFFGKNPFPLLINKSCVPNTAQRPKTTVSAGLGFSEATVTFRYCLGGKERRKARKCYPICFHFCFPKHISYFSLFASVFRISKQWKLAEGVGRRESCVLSVGEFLFVQTTWSFTPEGNWLRNTVSKRSADHWAGESWLGLSSQNNLLKTFNPLQKFVKPSICEMDQGTTNQNKIERSA